MRTRAVAIELLESRHMLSGDYSQFHYIGSELASGSTSATNSSFVAAAPFVASEPVASELSASIRWDWLANTDWYVKPENLLAYGAPPDLSNPFPVGDQTVWHIEQSSNGQITGEALAKLTMTTVPSQTTFVGVVTESGQVRLEFIQGPNVPPTTGVGQMRFVDGQWRVEMQMATSSDPLVTHWAYMSQLLEGQTPPDPSEFSPDQDLLSPEWRWIEGTHWMLVDSALFGDDSQGGVFAVDAYRNGYFWGSGTSSEPFNVLGSITPEGNVLLNVSVNGAEPQSRTGLLSNGMIRLHSYEGQPAIGSAWLLDDPHVPSSRHFMSSLLGVAES